MANLSFGAGDDREEHARAEVYALLAALFYAPPSDALLARLSAAPAALPGAFLEASWSALVEAAQHIPPSAVRAEYEALFMGLGKAEIFLYGSWFLAGALNETPLVALRHDLRALGLERPEAITETEDHIASLCEVMRFLIEGDAAGVSNLATQQRFYSAHLRGWVDDFCAAVAAHPRAGFYRALALFARDYFAVEAQAFDLLEAG